MDRFTTTACPICTTAGDRNGTGTITMRTTETIPEALTADTRVESQTTTLIFKMPN